MDFVPTPRREITVGLTDNARREQTRLAVRGKTLETSPIRGQRGALMKLEDYKTVLYRQEDGSWVAQIPAISGCYALMPTRDEALRELTAVFEMIAEEYAEKGISLPADSTEIVNA